MSKANSTSCVISACAACSLGNTCDRGKNQENAHCSPDTLVTKNIQEKKLLNSSSTPLALLALHFDKHVQDEDPVIGIRFWVVGRRGREGKWGVESF